MSRLGHIIEGWGKSIGLFDVSPDEQALSEKRMAVCAECPNAEQSRFLKLLKGESHNMDAIYCKLCKCPVNEKSLVKNETCPIGYWDIIPDKTTNII